MDKTPVRRIGCIFFLLVILLISARGEDLSLDMIFRYNLFSANKIVGIQSMNDGLHYSILQDSKDIIKYSYETGEKVETLFSLDWFEDLQLSEIISYALNKTETAILFGTGQEKVYRYSYRASYYVYDIAGKKVIPVFPEGKQYLAELSPDGSRVAFVFENNLYVKDIQTDKLIQITSDGLKNETINGSPDWLYEEEFTLLTGYYWSPDSRKIAYYRFDESKVHDYSLIFYESLYPELYTYKYPLAGD